MQWFHVKVGEAGTYTLGRTRKPRCELDVYAPGGSDDADLALQQDDAASSPSATETSTSTHSCSRASSTCGPRATTRAPSPATTGSGSSGTHAASQGRGLHPAARRRQQAATLTKAGNPLRHAKPGLVQVRRDRNVGQRHRPDDHSHGGRSARSQQLQGHAAELHQYERDGAAARRSRPAPSRVFASQMGDGSERLSGDRAGGADGERRSRSPR